MEYTMVIKINDVDVHVLIFKDGYSILLHIKILCMKILVLDFKKTTWKIIYQYVNSCYAWILRLDIIFILIFLHT